MPDSDPRTSESLALLLRALVSLDDPTAALALLQDLCTPRELEDLSQRLEVARMLDREQLEERLERILKHTEGVGEARVMITEAEDTKSFASDKENEGTVEGVVVVAQGATDPAVKKKIQDIVIALFPIEAHKIEIVKMKAD